MLIIYVTIIRLYVMFDLVTDSIIIIIIGHDTHTTYHHHSSHLHGASVKL